MADSGANFGSLALDLRAIASSPSTDSPPQQTAFSPSTTRVFLTRRIHILCEFMSVSLALDVCTGRQFGRHRRVAIHQLVHRIGSSAALPNLQRIVLL